MNFLANIKKESTITKLDLENEEVQNILKNLDEDQKKVVKAPFEPILCHAIAGSGKTRALTHRLAFLLSQGVLPNEIMLLTFTNKAANEMVERITKLTHVTTKNLMAGTFHHVAGRFLRKYAKAIGYNNNFTIYTPEDSKDLIKWIVTNKLKDKNDLKKSFPKTAMIYNLHSSSINKSKDIKECIKECGFSVLVNNLILEILNEYSNHKKENNIMDFDDLLVNFEEILKQEQIRDSISSQYKYLFIDEYQDVNDLQCRIIKLINNGNPNIFVVGDPNQSIYGFRGSNIKNIKEFNNEYENCRVYSIRYNYRSQGAILDLASDSINNNPQYEKIEMLAHIKNENKPQVKSYNNVFDEADNISRTIKSEKKSNSDLKYKDISILVRTNMQTNSLEYSFKKNGVPYKLLTGKSFVERKHIRDLISFLKFYSNPKDEVAFLRVIDLFDGCGQVSASKILHNFIKPYNESLENVLNYSVFSHTKLSEKVQISWNKFVDMMTAAKRVSTIEEQIQVIMDMFYTEYMVKNLDKKEERDEDIKFLLDMAKTYSDLNIFLENLLLENTSEKDNDDDKVTITTLHKSKGLEWDIVFIPTLNNGVFPKNPDYEVEENRRLFYVGVTRARKSLYLSFIHSEDVSIYLTELDENVFNYIK